MAKIKAKWDWTKAKLPEVFFIVLFTILFTIIITSFFSLFPFPAPGMSITEPRDGANFSMHAEGKDSNGYTFYNGTMFDVKITVNPGFWNGAHHYFLYDNEYFQRFFTDLNWNPKIWLMVRTSDSNKWTPFLKVEDFANGFAVETIALYVPATWDIEVMSLNARDDEFVSDYKAAIQTGHGQLQAIDRPRSAHPLARIRVRTINATK